LSDWINFHGIKQTFNSVDSVGNDSFFSKEVHRVLGVDGNLLLEIV